MTLSQRPPLLPRPPPPRGRLLPRPPPQPPSLAPQSGSAPRLVGPPAHAQPAAAVQGWLPDVPARRRCRLPETRCRSRVRQSQKNLQQGLPGCRSRSQSLLRSACAPAAQPGQSAMRISRPRGDDSDPGARRGRKWGSRHVKVSAVGICRRRHRLTFVARPIANSRSIRAFISEPLPTVQMDSTTTSKASTFFIRFIASCRVAWQTP